ncbi:MAG TPA: tetrathionate reductase family octaheme c-type cytochrome [Thermoanaerobaculia bacterium]|nr:tetrathionate reductase family octaheme c-type cytochrome [Thermoanaerobaculia bacterium]HQR66425.1 tetrathionate reductase family octaheme c-type cytochrome [Thermoanaerobaculia bacterium]
MREKPLPGLTLLLAMGAFAARAAAGTHAEYVGSGPFATGPDVTKKCLECHDKEARAFLTSAHWTWAKKQTVDGKSIEVGKKNVVNNFCLVVPSNWPRCTSCHAGYGWKDAGFDVTKAENIDCLVCHDTTGTYRKFPTGAGHPVYAGEKKEFPKGQAWEPVDLVKVARNVGKPTRASCGSCHFYGGGGDHVKHGDLDSSLKNPSPAVDVHMGSASKMVCQSCHKGDEAHTIKGEARSVSYGTGAVAMGCTDCHKAEAHTSAILIRHTRRVACQTCHIPRFAKDRPTKVWWDWSTAGKDVKPEEVSKDKYGEPLYDRMKGTFVWEKDVVPTYLWYDGTVDRVLLGDKVDPSRVVRLTSARGDRGDPKSKIFPFKIMKGKQPYDSGNRTVAAVNLFGPEGYWSKYDWNLAISNGMAAAGQPYSGKFGWIETSMVWPVNHMVAPKEAALKCADCHSGKGRLDWKALGYPGDPGRPKGE